MAYSKPEDVLHDLGMSDCTINSETGLSLNDYTNLRSPPAIQKFTISVPIKKAIWEVLHFVQKCMGQAGTVKYEIWVC